MYGIGAGHAPKHAMNCKVFHRCQSQTNDRIGPVCVKSRNKKFTDAFGIVDATEDI
jgi:hypothetical protein